MEEKKKVIVIGSGLSTGDAYAKMFAESEKFKVVDFPTPAVKWIPGVDPFDEVRPKLFGEKDKVALNYLANVDRFWREGEDKNQMQPVSGSLQESVDDIGKAYWYDQMLKINSDAPKLPHWSNPVEPKVWGDKINKDDLENLVSDILAKTPVSVLDEIMMRNPQFHETLLKMVEEQHSVIIQSRNMGRNILQSKLVEMYNISIEEKERVLKESEKLNEGVDQYGNQLGFKKDRKKVTNYTKPKNRKKKK